MPPHYCEAYAWRLWDCSLWTFDQKHKPFSLSVPPIKQTSCQQLTGDWIWFKIHERLPASKQTQCFLLYDGVKMSLSLVFHSTQCMNFFCGTMSSPIYLKFFSFELVYVRWWLVKLEILGRKACLIPSFQIDMFSSGYSRCTASSYSPVVCSKDMFRMQEAPATILYDVLASCIQYLCIWRSSRSSRDWYSGRGVKEEV